MFKIWIRKFKWYFFIRIFQIQVWSSAIYNIVLNKSSEQTILTTSSQSLIQQIFLRSRFKVDHSTDNFSRSEFAVRISKSYSTDYSNSNHLIWYLDHFWSKFRSHSNKPFKIQNLSITLHVQYSDHFKQVRLFSVHNSSTKSVFK